MLSFIKGKVVSISGSSLTLFSGGLGFSLQVPCPEKFELEKEETITTYLHWNADNGPSLFGFGSQLEKEVFLLVISCSGLGPKIGMAVLSQLSPAEFIKAVQGSDDKALSSVSGIGPKKAEQMVVQLRHKVAKLVKSGIEIEGADESFEQWKNLSDVLQSLNYSRVEIETAIAQTRQQYAGSPYTFDQIMRHSLSFLAKKM